MVEEAAGGAEDWKGKEEDKGANCQTERTVHETQQGLVSRHRHISR